MKFKNTTDQYGAIAQFFHWAMAFIILSLLLVGLYMTGLEYSPKMLEIYALHKSFGLLVLWLVGLRILWRLFTKQPKHQENHHYWERILAKLAHLFLYVAMVGMPLSGWLMSSAGEYPVPFFGIQMPDLVSKNMDLAKFMKEVHEILGFVLIGVILLHAVGALKHHFIDKDTTLMRMMANPIKKMGPYVLILILGIFTLGVLGLSLIGNQEKTNKPKVEEVLNSSQNFEIIGPNSWDIVKEQSGLNFKASVYNKEFTGIFSNFDGKIIFDPDDLKNSDVDITIDIASVKSGDEERDTAMVGEEWFNVETFPSANFKTTGFEKKSVGDYLAMGELTIKNRTMPVLLPFQLEIVEEGGTKRAYMNGSMSLNRLDFGLGEGRWDSPESVGLDVVVQIKLVAVSL